MIKRETKHAGAKATERPRWRQHDMLIGRASWKQRDEPSALMTKRRDNTRWRQIDRSRELETKG